MHRVTIGKNQRIRTEETVRSTIHTDAKIPATANGYDPKATSRISAQKTACPVISISVYSANSDVPPAGTQQIFGHAFQRWIIGKYELSLTSVWMEK